MSKKIAWISILLVIFMTGCSLVPQFQSAREQYLETRVEELLDEMTTEEAPAAIVAATATEEAIATETVDETAEAEETVEVEEEPTAEVTEEATAETTEEEDDVKSLSTDPGEYLGDADWSDDMSVAGNWPTTTNDFNLAAFDNETLMITALSESFGWRIASTDAFADAYIEASIKVEDCSGKDDYGIIFRVPENSGYNRGYLYGITCDGYYVLRSWDGMTGEKGVLTTLKKYSESSLINAGKLETNRLGIMAVGNRLILFVNGVEIDEISDDTFSDGNFGIYINRNETENLTIYVDDVKYWIDPEVK